MARYDIESGIISSGLTLAVEYTSMYVSNGGVASDTTVGCNPYRLTSNGYNSYYAHYGSMFVLNGGIANNTDILGGRMYISSGGTANNTTITGSSYSVYNNTTSAISNTGEMHISGGIAIITIL